LQSHERSEAERTAPQMRPVRMAAASEGRKTWPFVVRRLPLLELRRAMDTAFDGRKKLSFVPHVLFFSFILVKIDRKLFNSLTCRSRMVSMPIIGIINQMKNFWYTLGKLVRFDFTIRASDSQSLFEAAMEIVNFCRYTSTVD